MGMLQNAHKQNRCSVDFQPVWLVIQSSVMQTCVWVNTYSLKLVAEAPGTLPVTDVLITANPITTCNIQPHNL